MIKEERFDKIWRVDSKVFGLLKEPFKISENNVRQSSTEVEIEEIKRTIAPNIKKIGLQQLPVVNGDGEVFIGGRRAKAYEINAEKLLPVEVRDIPAKEQMIASWSENFVKRDLTADEEGRIFKTLCEKLELSTRELEQLTGVSDTTIVRKIKIYDASLRSGMQIPYDEVDHGPKILNYSKITELLPLEKKVQDALIKEITENGLTRDEIRKIKQTTDAVKEMIEAEPEDVQDVAKDLFSDKFYTKDLNFEEAKYTVEELARDPHKLISREFPMSKFATEEEAQSWAVARGGVCHGKIEKWYIEFDPVKDKKLTEVEKNESTQENKSVD